MAINILKDIQVKESKSSDKVYFLNDGGGLRLKINTNDTKVWEFRYSINNKRQITTFKTYPTVSLKDARNKRDEYRKLLNDGLNPIEYFRNLKVKQELEHSGNFKNVMEEWLNKEAENTQENTHKGKVRLFNNDVLPFFRNKNIKDITTDDIVLIVDKKKISAPELASRLFNYMDNLFRYAVLKKYCHRNILTDIRKRDVIKPRIVKNKPKITDPKILKELVNDIYVYNGGYSVRNLLKLALHVPLRTENICGLKWEYVDFDKKCLTIPREQMKIKNPNLDNFRIPLTQEAINILNEQKIIQTKYTELKEYVFLGVNNSEPINKESPNRALQRMGYNNEEKGRKIRLHGFRGTFRSLIDTLDIENKFSFDVKERALDHHERNQVARAYNHKADFYKQLIVLMNFWSDFLEDLRK